MGKTTTVCKICNQAIVDNNAFAYGVGDDKGWRHRSCGPGSKAWKKKHGNSEITDLLTKRRKKGDGTTNPTNIPNIVNFKKDPLYRQIKEFCGRDKYMRFMDTVNKNHFDWSISVTINGHELIQTNGDPPLDMETLYEFLSN